MLSPTYFKTFNEIIVMIAFINLQSPTANVVHLLS